MVEEIKAYRADDGRLFDNAKEAEVHDISEEFDNWYRETEDTLDDVYGPDFFEWLRNHGTGLQPLLTKILELEA